ncbi:hypothetical protein Hanom_Chr14g01320901 [Helianthus anomalus]
MRAGSGRVRVEHSTKPIEGKPASGESNNRLICCWYCVHDRRECCDRFAVPDRILVLESTGKRVGYWRVAAEMFVAAGDWKLAGMVVVVPLGQKNWRIAGLQGE